VAVEIGRAVAALHNVERAVFVEAGVPVYDAETCRTRHLADLDRGAATGHVPTALLSRWERALEDVSAWRFAPTPVHGALTGSRLLVTFSDEDDAETASVRAVTGWEHAQIADPADDFAALFSECTPEAFESIVEAYSVTRIERPDRHLRHRAKVASELRLLTQLLDAVNAAEPPLITRRAAELSALTERVADAPDLVVAEPEPSTRMPAPEAPAPVPEDEAVDAAAATLSEAGDDDTQVLKTGAAADATAVIPPEELERLRGASDDEGAGTPPAEQGSDSWYEVLAPTPALADSESQPELGADDGASAESEAPPEDQPDSATEIHGEESEDTRPLVKSPRSSAARPPETGSARPGRASG
jgi:hypothetical protein